MLPLLNAHYMYRYKVLRSRLDQFRTVRELDAALNSVRAFADSVKDAAKYFAPNNVSVSSTSNQEVKEGAVDEDGNVFREPFDKAWSAEIPFDNSARRSTKLKFLNSASGTKLRLNNSKLHVQANHRKRLQCILCGKQTVFHCNGCSIPNSSNELVEFPVCNQKVGASRKTCWSKFHSTRPLEQLNLEKNPFVLQLVTEIAAVAPAAVSSSGAVTPPRERSQSSSKKRKRNTVVTPYKSSLTKLKNKVSKKTLGPRRTH